MAKGGWWVSTQGTRTLCCKLGFSREGRTHGKFLSYFIDVRLDRYGSVLPVITKMTLSKPIKVAIRARSDGSTELLRHHVCVRFVEARVLARRTTTVIDPALI